MSRSFRLALLLAAAGASGCAGLRLERVRAGSLSPSAAAELISLGDSFVIDLRPEADFRRGHLPGARSIPVRRLGLRRDLLPQDAEAPIVVYDDSGAVSDEAALWLVDQGYNEVGELTGGLEAWRKARLPLEGGAAEPGSL